MTSEKSTRLRFPKEYRAWVSARQRCRDENHHSYPDYGGRGITFSSAWDEFDVFLVELGPCPRGMSLDRKDPNGNYEPGNCRWATRLEQMRNRRNTLRLEFNGVTKTVFEWAEQTGVAYPTLCARLSAGWSARSALTRPVRSSQDLSPSERFMRRSARYAVKYAVRRGRLNKPTQCSSAGCCGKNLQAHHHKGYAKENQLDVVWLCFDCHHAAEAK